MNWNWVWSLKLKPELNLKKKELQLQPGSWIYVGVEPKTRYIFLKTKVTRTSDYLINRQLSTTNWNWVWFSESKPEFIFLKNRTWNQILYSIYVWNWNWDNSNSLSWNRNQTFFITVKNDPTFVRNLITSWLPRLRFISWKYKENNINHRYKC